MHPQWFIIIFNALVYTTPHQQKKLGFHTILMSGELNKHSIPICLNQSQERKSVVHLSIRPAGGMNILPKKNFKP